MCYTVYISTDSSENLTGCGSGLIGFAQVTDVEVATCIGVLDFPNKWYVTAPEGCSCGFRHLPPESVGLGFTEPQDWLPEGQDEIAATRELYRLLASLLAAGHKVDLVDAWNQAIPEKLVIVDVCLGRVPEDAFRLFEGHKFRLRAG
jgi:hypothetical protein